jgi:methyl-accepting chemotaxis protein
MGYEKQSDKIEALQKSMSDAEGAIRRMAEQTSSNLTLISKLREDLEAIRQQVARLSNSVEATGQLYDNQVQRYE